MALLRTRSAALFGIEAHLIDVEVDMYSGGSATGSVSTGSGSLQGPDTAIEVFALVPGLAFDLQVLFRCQVGVS